MSDARAKAEARRAKILAREMKVSALGTDDISLPLPSNTSVNKKIIMDINNNSGDNVIAEGDTVIDASTSDNSISTATTSSISIKERPIAARRHLIKSVTLTTVSDSAINSIDNTAITTDSIENVAAIVNHDDPEDESIEQFEKKDNAAAPSSSSAAASKGSTSKLVITKKTLKEIESEVAQNTAAFDAKTLSKGTTPDHKKDTNAATTTTDDDATTLKKSQQLKINKLPSNIQPSSVMRLVRLVIIVLLGLYQGYVVIRANNQVSKSSSSVVINDATEILRQSQPIISSSRRKDTTAPRTWSQWFISTLTSPFESSITAVGVAWWIASIVENTIAIRVCLYLYDVMCGLIDQLSYDDVMFDVMLMQLIYLTLSE